MHPMFVELFIETDADDLHVYEEEKRRRSRQAKQSQSRMVTRVNARSRSGLPRRP
jgi:hypothetical protein